MADKYWRQRDIISPENLKPLVFIGAGGINSPTILFAAKMGAQDIMVFDNDKVSIHNLPNSMYRDEDVGKFKVKAISDIVRAFAGIRITAVNAFFAASQRSKLPSDCIVISGVDDMDVRKAIWDDCIKYNSDVALYIDGRMGGQFMRIYSIFPCDPDDVEYYESPKVLYKQSMRAAGRCTNRAIIYNTASIAGQILGQVRKFCVGELDTFKKEILFDFTSMMFMTTPGIKG